MIIARASQQEGLAWIGIHLQLPFIYSSSVNCDAFPTAELPAHHLVLGDHQLALAPNGYNEHVCAREQEISHASIHFNTIVSSIHHHQLPEGPCCAFVFWVQIVVNGVRARERLNSSHSQDGVLIMQAAIVLEPS